MSDIAQRILSLSPHQRALLAQQLQKREKTSQSFPLSFAQQQIWLLDQLEPGNPSYNITTLLRFHGHLNKAALEQSFNAIVQRHGTLRTTFTLQQEQPVQIVAPSATLWLPVVDLSNLDEHERELEVQRQAKREARHSFNLAQGPLLRISLYRLSNKKHVLFLNIHHIIFDGWSLTILQQELAATYTAILNGEGSPLPPLPIQYVDYALWQRQWLQGAVLEQEMSYWRQQLAGAPTRLELPTDRPRPAIQTYHGALETLTLSPTLVEQLRNLSRQEGVTLYMTLLTVFQLLLSRWSGQVDLVVGTPVANRNRTEIEELIGFFVNSLALRTDLSGDPSFRELLGRVRKSTLEAYAHQELPFDKLLEMLSPERDLSHTPLFQVFFNMINLPAQTPVWPGLSVDLSEPDNGGAKFDLTLYVIERDGDIRLELSYNRDLFDQPRMCEMLAQFALLASQILHAEEKISHFSLVTSNALAALPNPTLPLSDRWEGSVCRMFEQQVRQSPDRLAIVDSIESLSYQELNRRSNRIAHYLQASGITRGDVVALYAHRSLPLVEAVLGILKAGAAFLILDPAYPVARLIEYLAMGNIRGFLYMEAAGALPSALEQLLSTTSCTCQLRLPEHTTILETALAAFSAENSAAEVGPDDLACLTFTSGSTGRPKGILQRHGPLSHFLPWQKQYFSLQEAERYSMLSGLSHDPLQREIFTPLCLGGTICIPSPEHMGTPGWLAQWMQREAINIAHLTPAMMQILTQPASGVSRPGFELPALRHAFTIGDKLTRRDVSRLYEMAPAVSCMNAYGSTETQRAVGYFAIPRIDLSISDSSAVESRDKEIFPLGRGLRDVQLLVLTATQTLAGIGELGEIYIRSPHLARAYLDDELLTRERFITNPFTGRAGDRLYKTGDLGRYRSDGNVDFAGRNDQQVKLRGFRIELAEIETTLQRHPAVQGAAVMVREDVPGHQHLVAYIVPAQAQSLTLLARELRAFLTTRLPMYMVPSTFVPLEALPLTPNHKLDFRALPVPETALSKSEATAITKTATEEIVAGIWARLLGLEEVGVDENFFELGGHSLLATQLIARISETFQRDVPLRTLFEAPTVAGLARHIEQQSSSDGSLKKQAIIPLPRESYRARLEESAHFQPSDQVTGDIYLFPASFVQERFWFLHRFEPGNAAYTLMAKIRIQGKLNLKSLYWSIRALVQRHEILRTTLVDVNGQLMQAITLRVTPPLTVVDLGGLHEMARQAQLEQHTREEAQRSFDLARGPLFSLTLLCLSSEQHMLLFSIHHSIADAWSADVFFHELNILYTAFCEGTPPPLPELPLQYADYAMWQRNWLQGDALNRQLTYWKTQLAAAPALLALPTDHPRPPLQSSRGARQPFHLSAALTTALQQLSQRHDVTLFMTLLAAWQTLLSRYSGQQDVLVGTPIAGRTPSVLENLIGSFVNTLVLRSDLSGDPPFTTLLKRVREVALSAYANQDLPFERLVEELHPQRSLSYSPLFQVLFILQNTPTHSMKLADLTLTPLAMERVAAKFDLTLLLWPEEGGLGGSLEYNTDLFEPATIARLLGHLQTLLEGIVATPEQRLSRLPLLTQPEQHLLLEQYNHTARPFPLEQTLPQLFAQQVARTPDAIALLFEQHALSYQELDRRTNQLARYLQRHGVGPASLVGVCVERSLDLLLAVLGILKAGAAYLPLDPAYPRDRLAFMQHDAVLAIVLSQQQLAPVVPAQGVQVIWLDAQWAQIAREEETPPSLWLSGEDLAYVIYTSGSTGRPKGVQIPHRALTNFLYALGAHLRMGQQEILLAVTSLSFDIAGLELFLPLVHGSRVVLVSRELARDGRQLAEALRSHAVTIMQATPSTWQMLLEAGWQGEEGLSMLCGGEALPIELARQLLPRGAALWNLYGPTETTIWSTVQQIKSVEHVIPLGQPIANTQIYLLDPQGQPVPPGVAGELYIGGAGLARGYLHQPALTAEKFLPHPFVGSGFTASTPGARLYKTGDLARYLLDGSIEYLGRNDEQIKLRGYRIELSEIEAILSRHPAVQQSVVVARKEASDDQRLIAYVVPEQTALTVTELRTFLKEKVPEYMLPAMIVFLPALPLTPNGKVDRRTLASFSIQEQESITPTKAEWLSTPVEELLIQLWEQVLQREHIGLLESFFDLGGHSLLATQLLARIRDAFQIELPLRSLFTAPTVAELAQQIKARHATALPPQIPRIVPAQREEKLPLSYAQQRLWFLEQWEANSSLYNIPVVLSLTGQLDVEALQSCLTALVQRHESLRTTFVVQEEQPSQQIHPAFPVSVPLVDLQGIDTGGSAGPSGDRHNKLVLNLAEAEAQRPFDLGQGPLFRVVLLRRGANEHVLLLTIHHIISDAWSIDLLFQELNTCYLALLAGQSPSLPPLPLQYADYAVWQRHWLQGETLQQQLAYWKTQLAAAPALLALPTDHPRPPLQSSRGARQPFHLSAALTTALQQLSQRHDVTLFMTLLAAWQTLLARYSGQQDVLVGTPIAGRTLSVLENLIGFFVNTLVLRSDLSGDPPFTTLLKRVREVALSAYAHQDLPFEKLVEELHPQRSLSYSPLFQVLFILQNIPGQTPKLADLTMTPLRTTSVAAKFDLTLVMWPEEGGLGGSLEYNTDLFEPATIARLLGHLQTLLEGIVATPEQRLSRLPLLTQPEQHLLLEQYNHTARPFPLEQTLPQLFAQQVARTPDAIALLFEQHALSYQELDRRTNQLARYLQRHGVGPASLVGVCVERSLDLLLAVLGILKAGAAYLPLDPAYPRERLALMLDDAQVTVLLSQQLLASVVPAQGEQVIWLDAQWAQIAREQEIPPSLWLSGEDLAYVIYTSGSTGRPKGVMGTHRATLNRLHWMWEQFPFAQQEVCCQKTPLSFVDSIWEMFGPLLRGITSVMLADEQVKDPYRLVSALAEHGITRIVLVPSLLSMIVQTSLDLETHLQQVRYWFSSGEALALELAERFLSRLPQSLLINLYGSSEVAADATCALISSSDGLTSIPLGQPIANTQIYLLDPQGQPVPPGVPGELYIGGAGLARGYLHQPALTAEKFLPHPFVGSGFRTSTPGARLYRTGDLARYLPDGKLEYLGRVDRQVKIRGYRIEVQEIEALLALHPSVQQSVVVARKEASDDQRLIAYVIPKEAAPTATELRTFLKEKVPEYMLPATIVFLPALPLTPNGKIDYLALPEPEREQREQPAARPTTPVEEVLADIWAEVLGLDTIGIFDNFFEMGGHSLLATQVISRVRALFQIELSVVNLFEEPTVAGFAAILVANEAAPGQMTAIANIRLKLKHMSPDEIRRQLRQTKKVRR